MSMLGERVGRTGAIAISPEARKRVRMSFSFEPRIRRSIGKPMRRAA
jgi:hypothetical protein